MCAHKHTKARHLHSPYIPSATSEFFCTIIKGQCLCEKAESLWSFFCTPENPPAVFSVSSGVTSGPSGTWSLCPGVLGPFSAFTLMQILLLCSVGAPQDLRRVESY